MPLHDFVCGDCGRRAVDVYVPIAIGASHSNLSCPSCGTLMDWIPQVGSMDAKEPFQQASISANGKVYPLNSLHDIRKAERDSEQMARNGEGQPLVWRDYSQEKSNGDRHTLARRMDRSMDTQDGFVHGGDAVDKAKVGVARGAEVAKRQGL